MAQLYKYSSAQFTATDPRNQAEIADYGVLEGQKNPCRHEYARQSGAEAQPIIGLRTPRHSEAPGSFRTAALPRA